MNAIILAAGKGHRMCESGYSTPKPLLPIMGIPNIERTIWFLMDFGITDITILVPTEHLQLYRYLKDTYNCSIIDTPMYHNTLYTMNFVKNKIDNTFIIEGDVVLTKNIFVNSNESFYYVTTYIDCEEDAWHPIISSDKIVDFEIGKFNTPCIFGVSFWSHRDSYILQKKLNEYFVPENFEDPSLFWDDCIIDILDEIELHILEISNTSAYEMNNGLEYNTANNICKDYYENSEKFLKDSIITLTIENCEEFSFIKDDNTCREWQRELLIYCDENYKKKICYDNPQPIVFNNGEYPLMLYSQRLKQYVAYLDIAESSDYILLRRLLVGKEYRNKKIGTKILEKIKLYAKLTNKELRVNVYDESLEPFYMSLGMELYFKTFRI